MKTVILQKWKKVTAFVEKKDLSTLRTGRNKL